MFELHDILVSKSLEDLCLPPEEVDILHVEVFPLDYLLLKKIQKIKKPCTKRISSFIRRLTFTAIVSPVF